MEGFVERGTEAGRIVYFSDAVFAVAITLMMFQIRVPEGLSPRELTAALVDLWPQNLSYLISFAVIGGLRRTHYRIFRHVKSYDRRLISFNFLFFMCVAFLPFSLLGKYTEQGIALEVYASSVAGVALAHGNGVPVRDPGRKGRLEPRRRPRRNG